MAPEQASGEPGLDHRADLYAVGVLAYELLSGQRPFQGASIQQLLIAQAARPPVPLLELRPDTPPLLAEIVMRCLEKRPEDRYESAHQLLAALETLPSGNHSGAAPVPARPDRNSVRTRAVGITILALAAIALLVWRPWSRFAGAASSAGRIASVAVLPPEYFRPDSAVAATLADLVDHISNDLSRVEGLKVVNYMSVGALLRRGTTTPPLKDMGQALGVENFVLFVPGRTDRGTAVSVELINAATQAQLWVARYAPDSGNFDDINDDVVSRVTHSLLGPGAHLPPEAHSARARREGAHAEYLAGQRALRRRTPEGVSEAVRLFESAIRLDSTHAEAIGRLATALALQLSYGYRTTLPSYPTAARALALAERAMRLEPDRGDPVAFRAYIEYLAFAPLATVRADFERAIGMRPSEADVAGWHALMLLREGKTELSLAESRRALELDPLSSARHLTYALAALGARRYAVAELEARRATEMEPTLRRARQVEALAMLLQDRGAQCTRMELAPYAGVKAMCLRAAGREKESRAMVDSLRAVVALDGETDVVYSDVLPAQELATYYAWVGNTAESLKYLRLAFSRSPVGVDQRIVQSGVFDRVRQTPGFSEELARLQDAAWPRVMEQRQRLDESDGGMPLGALPTQENRHGG
jgi:serine/threonine-protein kinase